MTELEIASAARVAELEMVIESLRERLQEVGDAGFTAADMATAEARGFRDGQAAAQAAVAAGWMPIDSAPKNKANVLLLRLPCGSVANGFWLAEAYAGNGAWIWPYVHKTPTHWKAFSPPSSAKGVAHE